jgi:hypothetical protein
MGQLAPLSINLDEVHERYGRPDFVGVRASLAEVELGSDLALFSTYLGSAADFAPWTARAALNTDANLRLSYLAGWGINSNLADDLYRKMLMYRKPPTGIFTGTPGRVEAVLSAIRYASSTSF